MNIVKLADSQLEDEEIKKAIAEQFNTLHENRYLIDVLCTFDPRYKPMQGLSERAQRNIAFGIQGYIERISG